MKVIKNYIYLLCFLVLGGCATQESDTDIGALQQSLTESLFTENFEGSSHGFSVSGVCSATSAAARSGSAGIRCDDSASLTVSISTVGATNIQLSYSRRTSYYDSGEQFIAEFSVDGGASWHTIESIANTTTYEDMVFDLDEQVEDADLTLRFRSNANGFFERFDLDEVEVQGEINTGTTDDDCDGIDDDNDGQTDEEYVATPTECGTGACYRTGQNICDNGAVVDTCDPGTPASSDPCCDGIDNDCDGDTDEDTGEPDDDCDGIDDDNDGQTDEEYVATPTECGTGACYRTGQNICDNGAVVDTCDPGIPASSDPCCDGIDNDCDGSTDEDTIEPSTLFSEDFETSLEQFTVSGTCIISTSAPRSGSQGARCDDSASLTATVNTAGFENLTLEYSRRTNNYDSNETFFAEVSLDGETWTILEQTANDTTYRDMQFSLGPDFDQQREVLVRFRSNANGFFERFDLDDVRVLGDPSTVQSIVDKVRNEANLPALAAGATFGNTSSAEAVSGIVRIDHANESVDIGDSFMIGSCTKSMTATLIGMLVQDGLLEWNDTILDILSLEDDHIVIGTGFEQVTIEEILSHTAGFVRDPATGIELDEDATSLEILTELLDGTREYEDESYHYSNTGYMVAGALAEYITGISYEDLLQNRIFTPLSMNTAGFGWPDEDYINEATDPSWYPKNPWGHASSSTMIDPENEKWLHPAWYPAGSVKCSVGDYLKYVNWHLQGHLDNDSELGLPQGFFEKLHDGFVETGVDPDLPELGDGYYALGWREHVYPDPTVGVIHAHGGNVSGFNALMVFSPSKNIAIVAVANVSGSFSDLVTTADRINNLQWTSN